MRDRTRFPRWILVALLVIGCGAPAPLAAQTPVAAQARSAGKATTFMKVFNSSGKDIGGDSLDEVCSKWIEIQSMSFSLTQATNDYSAGRSRTNGKPQFSDVSVSMLSNAASGALYGHSLSGDHLKKVVIRSYRPVGQSSEKGGRLMFQSIVMTEVIISSFSQSGGGGVPQESLTLNPGMVCVRFTSWDEFASPPRERSPIVHSYNILKGTVDQDTDKADDGTKDPTAS